MRRDLPDRLRDYPEWPLTQRIIGAFFETYNILGYGHLEAVYRQALGMELRLRGMTVFAEASAKVRYKDRIVGNYRMDLLVDRAVVVEVKSTPVLPPTDQRQLLNYLRASDLDVGLLLHYGPDPRFHRVVAPRVVTAARVRQAHQHDE